MSDWLKNELSRHLGPVRAPEALWDRIQNGRQAASLPRAHVARWAVAAAVTVATAIGSYWLPSPALRSNVVVLAASSQPDLRQDNPTEWDLRCAPPSSQSTVRIVALQGHPFEGGRDCQACHSMGLGQHHL